MTIAHDVAPLRKRESHVWARDPYDWYVEPAWVSARLFEAEKFTGRTIDPACGLGNIVVSGAFAGLDIVGRDVIARESCPLPVIEEDFLESTETAANFVSNPPFGIAQKFIEHALDLASCKVAMLMPAVWIQGDERSRWLESTPLRRVWFLCPRPSMPPGSVITSGKKPGNGTKDFAWFVWLRGYDGTPEIRWLRRDGGAA